MVFLGVVKAFLVLLVALGSLLAEEEADLVLGVRGGIKLNSQWYIRAIGDYLGRYYTN